MLKIPGVSPCWWIGLGFLASFIFESTNLSEWPAQNLQGVQRCPVCGSGDRQSLYKGLTDEVYRVAPGRWPLHACSNCTALYLDPCPSPDSIGRAYAGYATHGEIADSLAMPTNALAWLLRAARNGYVNRRYGYNIRPAVGLLGWLVGAAPTTRAAIDRWVHHLPKPKGVGKLLDVGCGNGDFLAQMRGLGWNVRGVDFDPEAAAVGQKLGLDIRIGSLSNETFPGESFDAITICHVIEHVHDPVELVRLSLSLLRPGGRLWLATPNTASLGHRYYRSHWRGLEAPRHLVLFNRRSMRELLAQAGYRGEVFFGHSPPWAPEFYFSASRAMARGEDPRTVRPSGVPLRAAAFLANLATIVRPSLGEELIAVATA